MGNIAGDDYLYVFRPENRDNVSEAFLSKNSGRTSFGTSDWSKGVKDNAITYSDGNNSGIVIDQVGEAADSITFRMTMPDYEELSLWNRTFAKAGTGRYDIISSKNGDVYFAAENQHGIEVKKEPEMSGRKQEARYRMLILRSLQLLGMIFMLYI